VKQRRQQEFSRFNNDLERSAPAEKVAHAIADNYGTHKHPAVLQSLADRPRLALPRSANTGIPTQSGGKVLDRQTQGRKTLPNSRRNHDIEPHELTTLKMTLGTFN